jgi:hypothetical protein
MLKPAFRPSGNVEVLQGVETQRLHSKPLRTHGQYLRPSSALFRFGAGPNLKLCNLDVSCLGSMPVPPQDLVFTWEKERSALQLPCSTCDKCGERETMLRSNHVRSRSVLVPRNKTLRHDRMVLLISNAVKTMSSA